jgi:hypothetical protein
LPIAAAVAAAVSIAAVAVSSVAASEGPLARGPAWSFGAFAGYQWAGRVTEIRAQWVVSQIESAAPRGAASTWIGAEAPGSTETAPFIQVGTQEQQNTPRYAAFWSDTLHGFHPQVLFSVAAGDTIAASLQLSGERWEVVIFDLTSGANDSFVTRDEAAAAFNNAQWLQEDETDLRTSRALPYPQLAPTRFADLIVNGSVPQPDRLSPRWMSLPGNEALGPKRTGDGFIVGPMQLSADAEQFLALAVPYDAAVKTFRRELRQWNASTPVRRTRIEAARVAAATRVFISRLTSLRWPRSDESLVSQFIDALRERVIVTQPDVLPTPRDIGSWRQAWYHDVAITRAATAIASKLDVPSDVKPASH